ncbi:MAG: AAA family ATPase [Planctomycetota bacterium]|nr:AAA family ATPase [Planctomycetota bacterium]
MAALQVRLRSRLPEPIYIQWFSKLEILSWEDGRLELGVPNRFFKERIETAYLAPLLEAAGTVAGQPVRVAIAVSPRLFAAFKKSRERDLASAADLDKLELAVPRSLPEAPGGGEPPLRKRPGQELNQGFTFENFVIGSSNRLSHAIALQAAERPGEYNPIYVCGQHGLGKTHLLQAVCHAARRLRPEAAAVYVSSERFVHEFGAAHAGGELKEFRRFYQQAEILAFDDLQNLGSGNKAASQAELLRLIDDFAARGRQTVFAATRTPEDLEGVSSKLKDRLGAGFIDRLSLPDEETRRELVVRKMRERRIDLPPAAAKTLAAGLSGNVRKLEGAVNRLAALIRMEGREPTLACIRAALEVAVPPARKSALTHRDILEATAEEFGVTVEALIGRGRTYSVKRARQAAVILCRRLVGGSYAELGGLFGRRGHATLISILKNAPGELFSSASGERPVERILFRLGLSLKPEDLLDRRRSLFPDHD